MSSRPYSLVPSTGPPVTLSGLHDARKGVISPAFGANGVASNMYTSPPLLGVSPRLVCGSLLERQQHEQMQQQYERAVLEARAFADARARLELDLLTKEDEEEEGQGLQEPEDEEQATHFPDDSVRRGKKVGAITAKPESNKSSLRRRGQRGDDGFYLSDSEEEWLCSQFAGHERLLLHHSSRVPFPRSRAPLSSCSTSSPRLPASSQEKAAKMTPSGGTEGTHRVNELTGYSPTTPPFSGRESSYSKVFPNARSTLLPFSHWLGILALGKKETMTSGGRPSLPFRSNACPAQTTKGIGGLETPDPLTPLLDLLPLDLQRSIRKKGAVFLQAQKRKEEESRIRILQAARKKRTSRAVDRRAPRRGCDAVDSAEEKDESSSSEGEQEEPCIARRRKHAETTRKRHRGSKDDEHNRDCSPAVDTDGYGRGTLHERSLSPALSKSREQSSGWTPTPVDCTRLLAFDSLSCPALTKLADEKLPGILLRYLQSRARKGTDAEGAASRTAEEVPNGKITSGPQSSSDGCSEGVENLEEELDESEAAVPLLVRLVTQRVTELPVTNMEAKANLLRYQVAAHSVEWKAALLSGYSILVTGFGSKKTLLDLFAQNALREGFCCIINGYRRELRLQYCLLDLLYAVARHVRKDSSKHPEAAAELARILPKDQRPTTGGLLPSWTGGEPISLSVPLGRVAKQEVKRLARRLRVPLYFVVHNLDGPALRGDSRRALASLAACSNIHFVCSADHRLHSCLLGASEREDFNFIHQQCHTYQDYRTEVLGHWGPSCMFVPLWLRNSGGATGFSAAGGGASGVWGSGVNFSAVVDALTTNHKRLLKCLAEKQLSQIKSGEGPAVSMEALSNPMFALTGNFDRSKVLQLLVELTSHGAAVKTSVAGQEALYIRANQKQLESLLSIFEQRGI
ncbi:origin recognition complex subunit [Cystoisospora suis]|uniref:Origin recognition complex subunit n=1 Tax=Cystoisospora suis TaxID=483139 RepID=A0A2C6L4V6_9APIC|nr:origin recognition complex subunit [Cystoisospora suis]